MRGMGGEDRLGVCGPVWVGEGVCADVGVKGRDGGTEVRERADGAPAALLFARVPQRAERARDAGTHTDVCQG